MHRSVAAAWRHAHRVGPVALALGLLARTGPAVAQERPVERTVAADGFRLDYAADGAWRVRGRVVRDLRARLRSERQSLQLNAAAAHALAAGGQPAPASSAARSAALTGTLRFPTVLLDFGGIGAHDKPAAMYDSVMYTGQPLTGRPYSVRTFYEEMSNGLFTVDGRSYGWLAADSVAAYYLEACGSQNAIECFAGRSRMRALFVSALARLDPDVNFATYDNDGPDGVPNSGDDDGVVDLVQLVHSETGGECRGRGYWAHKSSLGALGGRYRTADQSASGGSIFVNSYHVVSGINATSCSDGLIMGIGVASHELGHSLGLPDLYSTSGVGEGIGEWGLMGSGSYASMTSPGHLEAWSKDRLGWVVVREVTPGASYRLGPVVTADSVLLVRPAGLNPRGEYYLLENKQPIGADTANLLTGRATGPKRGGLLVWHIDSARILQTEFSNQVNAVSPLGVALVQADNARHLERDVNRGDAGDPFPGTSGATALTGTTEPANHLNQGGAFAGFGLHRIEQLEPEGAMGFYLAPGWIVRSSGPEQPYVDTPVLVNAQRHVRYHDAPDSGSVHTVSVDQSYQDYWYQFEFTGWSNGGARTQTVTLGGEATRDSLVALMERRYKVEVQVTGPGMVTVSPPVQLFPGVFHAENTMLTLAAVPDSSSTFEGWRSSRRPVADPLADTLALTLTDAHALEARFAPTLLLAASNPPTARWGASYSYQFVATGGSSPYHWWGLNGGALPEGVDLSVDGRLSGIPRELGVFTFSVMVISAAQSVTFQRSLHVTAPPVSAVDAARQIFTPDSLLEPVIMEFLDYTGNQNGTYDLGDYLALLHRGVTTVTPPPVAPAPPPVTRGKGG
ncbi:MAG TPA: M6 family metalloprotease domain-containing protein [Gemmatimonadales bacterium]|nr:M6 family metalloprotease domain-containing protein [Gemmatimonadales bacterium]